MLVAASISLTVMALLVMVAPGSTSAWASKENGAGSRSGGSLELELLELELEGALELELELTDDSDELELVCETLEEEEELDELLLDELGSGPPPLLPPQAAKPRVIREARVSWRSKARGMTCTPCVPCQYSKGGIMPALYPFLCDAVKIGLGRYKHHGNYPYQT